jgi:hypothetical protein
MPERTYYSLKEYLKDHQDSNEFSLAVVKCAIKEQGYVKIFSVEINEQVRQSITGFIAQLEEANKRARNSELEFKTTI